jgi:hypothetical protein
MRIKTFTGFNKLLENQNAEDSNIMDSCCSGTWEVRDDLIYVDGDFLASKKLKNRESLGNLKFGEVTGDFDVSDNNLKTLEGCPSVVGGSFNCSSNRITTLKGGPESARMYYCSNNFISDISDIATNCESYAMGGNIIEKLVEFPEEIKGSFLINDNELLESLNGCPRVIGKNFDASNCQSLVSLEGGPEEVGKNYLCSGSNLDSLSGIAKKIGGFLDISGNKLRNLEGIPEIIGRWVAANNNEIISLEGLTGKSAGRSLMLSRNIAPENLLKIQHNFLKQGSDKRIEGNNWVIDILERSPKSLFDSLSNYRQLRKKGEGEDPAKDLIKSLGLEKISHESPGLLAPLIIELKKSNKYDQIRKYVEDNIDLFSDDFKEDYGVSKDLSDLGF